MALNGLNDALELEVLEYFLGAQAMTAAPGTWYVALFTAAPDDDGTGGTEVTGGSYARVAVTNNTTNFPSGSAGDPSNVDNGTAITFTTATADWGTVVAWALFTASSGGTAQLGGTVTPNKTIDNGDTASFAAGDLNFEA